MGGDKLLRMSFISRNRSLIGNSLKPHFCRSESQQSCVTILLSVSLLDHDHVFLLGSAPETVFRAKEGHSTWKSMSSQSIPFDWLRRNSLIRIPVAGRRLRQSSLATCSLSTFCTAAKRNCHAKKTPPVSKSGERVSRRHEGNLASLPNTKGAFEQFWF